MEIVIIKGVEHKFKLGVAACKKVERLFGTSIFEVLGANPDGTASAPTISNLSVLFWAAAQYEKPELTQEEADILLDDYLEEESNSLETLIELITKALNFTKGSPKAQAVGSPL